MKKAFRFVIFFLFTALSCTYGQTPDSTAYYLDDNNLSDSKNVIKVDVIAIAHGELPFIYERVLNERFSVEAGLGLLLPYYVHDFLPVIFNRAPDFSNHTSGNSVWLKTKLYLDRAPEMNYIDFTFRRRNFSHATLTDISFGLGRQLIIGARMIVDLGIGMGIRRQKSAEGQVLPETDFITLPLQIKAGYLF